MQEREINNHSVIFRCTPGLRAELERLAGDTRKLSEIVRDACQAYIAAKGDGKVSQAATPVGGMRTG